MENKKKIVIVISILLIYFVIMMIFFGFDSLKKKVNHLEILISPTTYLKYEKGVWEKADEDATELLGKTYQIYGNHQYLYDAILQYTEDKWYAFDKNNKPLLSFPKNFFAYRGNMKVDVVNYHSVEMSEAEIKEATNILKKYNITFQPSFTKTMKLEFDFNNDGVEENLYIISNALGMEEQSIYFSIAYIENSGNIEILIEKISDSMYQIPTLNLRELIDINQDKKYEFVFEYSYFDQLGTSHEIFEYQNGIYKAIKIYGINDRGDEDK